VVKKTHVNINPQSNFQHYRITVVILAWFATQPYLQIMQSQIVTYHHLAVIFAWSPVASLCGTVFTGKFIIL